MKKKLPLVLSVLGLLILVGGISYAQDFFSSEQNESGAPSVLYTEAGMDSSEMVAESSEPGKYEPARLKLHILRCAPDGTGVGECPPVGSGGICEGEATRASAFTAHAVGIQATPDSGNFAKPVKISYMLTAIDEQGLDVIIVPLTAHNERTAPFIEPLNLAFTASLQSGEYKLVVNVESPDAGTTFQVSTPLIIADPAYLEKNPEYCNAVMDAP